MPDKFIALIGGLLTTPFHRKIGYTPIAGERDACYVSDMADMNIRNVPVELIQKLKSAAALNGVTLREYVLMQLGEAEPHRAETRRKPLAGLDRQGAQSSAEMPTAPPKSNTKTCQHGKEKGYHCWQCGGLAQA